MTDLMDEIGEDLRQQQLKLFWQENRNWIIGGIILAIVTTAALSFWRTHQYNKNVTETSALLQVAKEADAEKIADLAKSSDKEHAALAQFTAAGLYLQQGKKSEAAQLYAQIEKTRGLDRLYRDLAALYAVRLDLETGDAQALHKKLDDLTDDGNPWRFTALETRALLFAREGKKEEAVEALSAIASSADAPPDARTRASTLRELYLGEQGSN